MTTNASPRIPTITVSLRPFGPVLSTEEPPIVSTLLVTFSARPGGSVCFEFVLEGRIDALRLPAADAPDAWPLWEHTCFEAFLSLPGEEAYNEYNFSPAGLWAATRFRRYREAERPLDDLPPPALHTVRHEDKLTLEVELPPALLPPGPVLRVGLTAVIEQKNGHLGYWAVHHPADRPDFHHRDGWMLELDTRQGTQ